jgi:hypothetical protein
MCDLVGDGGWTWASVGAFFQGLLTIIIGMIVAYIAWQQYKANVLNLRLARYDRRFKVYDAVKQFLSAVMRDARVSPEDLQKLGSALAESDFLFGREVQEYIDEVYRRGFQFRSANEKYDQTIQTAQFDPNIADQIDRDTKWFCWSIPRSSSTLPKKDSPTSAAASRSDVSADPRKLPRQRSTSLPMKRVTSLAKSST